MSVMNGGTAPKPFSMGGSSWGSAGSAGISITFLMAHLPFVYALWLIRPEVSFPKPIADCLRACRDDNLRELDSVIAAEKEFSPQFCAYYFRECLTYHLGRPEREGLAMFQELCETHGILPRRSTAVL